MEIFGCRRVRRWLLVACAAASVGRGDAPTRNPVAALLDRGTKTKMLASIRAAGGLAPREANASAMRGGFVIVTVQRTGSTWLVEEIQGHPCLAAGKEIFLNQNKPQNVKPNTSAATIANKYSGFVWSTARRQAALNAFYDGAPLDDDANVTYPFRHFAKHCRSSGAPTCGFKWMLSQHFQDDWPAWFRAFCRDRGVSLIFLTRENLLRVRVSSYAKDNAHQSIHVPGAEQSQLVLETGDALLHSLGKLEGQYAFLADAAADARAAGVPTLALRYEDLVANTSAPLDAVATYVLKRSWCTGDVRHHWFAKAKERERGGQIHADPLRSYIRNWDDVERTLAGTRFEKYLYYD